MISIFLLSIIIIWSLFSFNAVAESSGQLFLWYNAHIIQWPYLIFGKVLFLLLAFAFSRMLFALLFVRKKEVSIFSLKQGFLFLLSLGFFLAGSAVFLDFLDPANYRWGGALGYFLTKKMAKSLGENPATAVMLAFLSISFLIHIKIGWLSSLSKRSINRKNKPSNLDTEDFFNYLEPEMNSNQAQMAIQELNLNINNLTNQLNLESQGKISAAKTVPWFSVSEKKGRIPLLGKTNFLSKKKSPNTRLKISPSGEFLLSHPEIHDRKGRGTAPDVEQRLALEINSPNKISDFWSTKPSSMLASLEARPQNELFIFEYGDKQGKLSSPELPTNPQENLTSVNDTEFLHYNEENLDDINDTGIEVYTNPNLRTSDSIPYVFSAKLDEPEVIKETFIPGELHPDEMESITRDDAPGNILDAEEEDNDFEEKYDEDDLDRGAEEREEILLPGQETEDSTEIEFEKQKTDRNQSEIGNLYYAPEEFVNYQIPANVFEESIKENELVFKSEIENRTQKLEETLLQFGIEAKVVGTSRGPVVTMYEVVIAPGIKVNRITNLSDDLAMALASESVRIVAPIPGKSAIGIEVPNYHRIIVRLGDLWKNVEKESTALEIPLGKKITGEVLQVDLTRMPHLLIAGATGSGKSVCVNSIISSLIFRYDPSYVRFILIDPKLVELTLYNGIPHLLYPVITDAKTATIALFWVIQEMERRYAHLSELNVRDLNSYNEKVEKYKSQGSNKYSKLPYLVILIDEFADLMMVSGKELEDFITRIAQKARAVGIHLVLATQRPSVNIITGVIKANFPARIAFQVASKIDSRTIIDQNGAEKLLGKGDMLYQSPYSSFPLRIQSAMVKEKEVMSVVNKVRSLRKNRFIDLDIPDDKNSFGSLEEDDELFENALEIIQETRKASASYLQRRLKIGYNRAARLIETMEERGFISAQHGSKPREILMDNF
jgi:hypothetical protein